MKRRLEQNSLLFWDFTISEPEFGFQSWSVTVSMRSGKTWILRCFVMVSDQSRFRTKHLKKLHTTQLASEVQLRPSGDSVFKRLLSSCWRCLWMIPPFGLKGGLWLWKPRIVRKRTLWWSRESPLLLHETYMRQFVSRTAEYVVWPDARSGVHKIGIQNARGTARCALGEPRE